MLRPYGTRVALCCRVNTKDATPKKLSDGTWGAEVKGSARVGEDIVIRTRSGKTWSGRVATVIVAGPSDTIVRYQRTHTRSRPRQDPYNLGHGAHPWAIDED